MREILWSAIVRWSRPRSHILRLRIPCSERSRAEWLRKMLGTGKVDGASVVVYGARTAKVARRLGWPEEVCRRLEELPTGRGRRDGVREIQRRRMKILDEVFPKLHGGGLRGSSMRTGA